MSGNQIMTSPPAAASPGAIGHKSYTGRPPRWLLWLFPGLGDLSENPLYIRLAGQGYGRRGFSRLFSGPVEFRAASIDWLVLGRLGLWPFLVFVGSAWTFDIGFNAGIVIIMLWAFLLASTRLLIGRPRHAVVHFYRRARVQGWGEDLILAGFTPRSINAAIMAALLPRVAMRIFLVGAGWAAVILWNIADDLRRSPSGDPHALMLCFLTVYFWFLTWIFFCGLETFDIYRALAESSLEEQRGAANVSTAARGFFANGLILAMLLAGPFMIGLLSMNPLTEIRGPGSASKAIAWGCVIGVFTVGASILLIRNWISKELFKESSQPGRR